MGIKLELVILFFVLLVLAKLYGETFVGMLGIIGGWLVAFLLWFVDLVGRTAPK